VVPAHVARDAAGLVVSSSDGAAVSAHASPVAVQTRLPSQSLRGRTGGAGQYWVLERCSVRGRK
jgi:hypothetical protein